MHKVFAYGTLRPKDIPATHRLDRFQMYDYGAYPYIIETGNVDAQVLGVMLEVDDDGLAALDKYENTVNGLFRREVVECWPLDDSTPVDEPEECFTYVAGPALDPPYIVSGDWYNRD